MCSYLCLFSHSSSLSLSLPLFSSFVTHRCLIDLIWFDWICHSCVVRSYSLSASLHQIMIWRVTDCHAQMNMSICGIILFFCGILGKYEMRKFFEQWGNYICEMPRSAIPFLQKSYLLLNLFPSKTLPFSVQKSQYDIHERALRQTLSSIKHLPLSHKSCSVIFVLFFAQLTSFTDTQRESERENLLSFLKLWA